MLCWNPGPFVPHGPAGKKLWAVNWVRSAACCADSLHLRMMSWPSPCENKPALSSLGSSHPVLLPWVSFDYDFNLCTWLMQEQESCLYLKGGDWRNEGLGAWWSLESTVSPANSLTYDEEALPLGAF